MFEFEAPGGMDDLENLERQLCEHLGFGKAESFKKWRYQDAARVYEVDEIGHEEEFTLCADNKGVVFLSDFPYHTSPFWNMRKNGDTANKIDVLLKGMETIGSAERSSDPDEMREQFHTISDGGYAKLLYDIFGKKRVEAELENFLANDFFPRFGGGIGLTRLIRAMS